MEIIYVANDGKKFSTEDECVRYERFTQSCKLGHKLRFFNVDFRELLSGDPHADFEDCFYVYVADEEALEFLRAMTEGDYWCDIPTYCGLFYYNEQDEAFYNLGEKISKLKSEVAQYEDLAMRCNIQAPYWGKT